MSNEPKAGKRIDPEMLAAYIDNRLPPEQRAAVEAQLATDPESYALLVDTLEALDDDEIKSLEVKEPSKQPIPFAPKPNKPRGRVVIAGGVLAIAAAIALVVWMQPEVLSRLFGGDPSDPLIARLAESVASERPIEARLARFPYAPLASTTRGASEGSRNLSLIASAGEIQRQAGTSQSPEVQKAWAAAQILTGDLDGATNLLTQLLTQAPEDASLHSDLAAALLERVARGGVERLPLALDHASQATRLDPRLPEAAFNYALALELSHLVPQAVTEWRRFMTIESDSRWRDEAARHISRLSQPAASKPSARVTPTVDRAPTPEALADLQASPETWRGPLEGDLVISALRDSTGTAWSHGIALARHFRAVTGDGLPLDIWTHAAAFGNRDSLQAGFLSLQRAQQLRAGNMLAPALEAFQRAERWFRTIQSPAAEVARFYEAFCLFNQGKTVESIALLEPLLARARPNQHLGVVMRGSYLLGLGWLRLGLHASVYDIQQRSAEMAARLGERGMEARARSEVADALERLSMREAAWRAREVVLRQAAQSPEPSVRHIATIGASTAAAAQGLSHAAEAFAEAALDNGIAWG
ncbi:MAG TPA: hypothetical protein VNT81_00005, partial [Vicinamibacterales bacterium]|nr:hypothetical protein [Vicinamibacterales bacterium]